MLRLSNVSKSFIEDGMRVDALKDVTLTFPETGLVFLVGKSGSGKTTLLNLLGGLDRPTEGEIIFRGKPMSQFSAKEWKQYRAQDVAYLFQQNNVFATLTVRENILFSGGEVEACEAVAQRLEIGDVLNRKVNQLSGGQLQRVAIARAILQGAQVLLADEPTGNLDEKTGQEIFSILKELSSEKLVIVVTHDRESAERFGDVVIALQDGKIQEVRGARDASPTQRSPAPASPKRYRYAAKVGIAALFGKGWQGAISLLLSLCLLLCVIAVSLLHDVQFDDLMQRFVAEHYEDYPHVILHGRPTGMGGSLSIGDRPGGEIELSREVLSAAEHAPDEIFNFASGAAWIWDESDLALFSYTQETQILPLAQDVFYVNCGRTPEADWDWLLSGSYSHTEGEFDPFNPTQLPVTTEYYNCVIIDGEEIPFHESGLAIEDCVGMQFKLYGDFLSDFFYSYANEDVEDALGRVPVLTFGGIVREGRVGVDASGNLGDGWGNLTIYSIGYIFSHALQDELEEQNGINIWDYAYVSVDENFYEFLAEIGYTWGDFEVYKAGLTEDGTDLMAGWVWREVEDAVIAINEIDDTMQIILYVVLAVYLVLMLFFAVSALQRRRGELALMRALGMTRRQVFGACMTGIALLTLPMLLPALALVAPAVPFLNYAVIRAVADGNVITVAGVSWEAFVFPVVMSLAAMLLVTLVVAVFLWRLPLADTIRKER